MKLSIRVVCLLVIWIIGLSSSMAAEIRVLLSFDNAGHHVLQIVRAQTAISSANRLLDSDSRTDAQDIDSLIPQLQPRIAMLIWVDAEGRWQSRTREPDPRISHSPAHIDGSDVARFSALSGAWLVSGPDTASHLTILLPADPTVGLGFEQWDVSLVEN